MKWIVSVLAVTCTLGIVMGLVLGGHVIDAQQAPMTRTEYLKKDMAGMDGKEVIVYLAEIAPRSSSGKHYHAGHETVYVLGGSGSFEMEGMAAASLKPGDTAYVAPKHVHEAKNSSPTDLLRILVFAVHEKGQPLAIRVTEPYFWN
jgi:quercetin dioxygenase-like cupin family protein